MQVRWAWFTSSARVAVALVGLSLVLSAAVSGCGSSAPKDDWTWKKSPRTCSGENCLLIAEAYEIELDFLGARTALRIGCDDDVLEACTRLLTGPYLVADADLRLLARKSCTAGDLLGCERVCAFEKAEADALVRDACERVETQLPPMRSAAAIERACVDAAPAWRCQAQLELLGGDLALADASALRARLCLRDSAQACADELWARCRQPGGAPGRCTSPQLEALRVDPTLAPAVAPTLKRAEELCRRGVATACLSFPAMTDEQVATLCRGGYRPACDRLLLSAQPALAEPACLAGSARACAAILATLRDDPAQQLSLVSRMCASEPSSCGDLERLPHTLPAALPKAVDGEDAHCRDVVTRARRLSGLSRSPGEDGDARAERSCERHLKPAQRRCMVEAEEPRALLDCWHAIAR